MTDTTDVVVAGAGLAGACAALVLSRTRRVIVLDDGQPGASHAAAGLVNPFMGQKAKAAWRHDEALDALVELAGDAGPGLFRRTGVLRPASSPAQAEGFRARAEAHLELVWHTSAASRERWPCVASPHGILHVTRGGSVDLGAFVRSALDRVVARGGEVRPCRLVGWDTLDTPFAITDQGEIRTRALVLALGDGVRQIPALDGLPLHRVKGQTLHLECPADLPADHPAIAGAGYIVPRADGVLVGATFEHAFADLAPNPGLDAGLVAKAAHLLPALAEADVLDRRAGVRLTVPATVSPGRLPLAGPLPGHSGVWVVSGLGAKGLLTAPLIARRLPDALDGRQPLPAELWPEWVST